MDQTFHRKKQSLAVLSLSAHRPFRWTLAHGMRRLQVGLFAIGPHQDRTEMRRIASLLQFASCNSEELEWMKLLF